MCNLNIAFCFYVDQSLMSTALGRRCQRYSIIDRLSATTFTHDSPTTIRNLDCRWLLVTVALLRLLTSDEYKNQGRYEDVCKARTAGTELLARTK
jgi:hypothetical protein